MTSGTRRVPTSGPFELAGAVPKACAALILAVAAGKASAFQPEAPAEKPAEKAQAPKDKQPEANLATEESMARFAQLLERRPFHVPAFEGLVKGYVDRGKLKDLVAEYEAKSSALPDNVPLRILLARLYLRSGDTAKAAETLAKVESLPADMGRLTSDLLVLKAEVFQKSGDNQAAERVLKQAIEHAAGVAEKLRLAEALADLYLRDTRKEEAIALLDKMAGLFPDNYLHQRQIAGALAQRGLHEAAAERYRLMLPLVKDEVDRRCETLRELGQSLEKLGKRDEAIQAYVEAAGLLGSDHWLQKDLHERIVTLYRAGNRLADLAAFCEAQIKKSPEQTAMRVLLADVQGAMGQPDAGKKTLAEAVSLFPKDLALSQKRVEFLERLGDVEGVAAEFQRAIGQHPEDRELYIAYGQSLANNKQIEGARNQWRHVLGGVEDAGLAGRLGALFEAYELYDDAAEAYERAITANAKQPDAYTALSRLWMLRGDAEKAAAALTRMGEANPTDAAVHAARAQGLRNLGKAAEALEAITKACELAPDQVRYLQIQSELLVQNGRVEDALAVRRTIIDRMSNPLQQAEAIGTLVSMYTSADKLEALKEREGGALQQKPGDATSLLILVRIADAEHDFAEMRKRLDELLTASPGNEMALRNLAKLQDATGDMNGAVETYTKLIQNQPARARQSYEAIVDLKLRYQDRAGAIETLESMAGGDLASAATQSAVAEQLVRMGEPERALAYFERTLKVQPDRHEARLDYGKALVDAGRLDDAMVAFRAVATQRSDTDRAVEAIGKLHDAATQLGKLEELLDELQREVTADPGNTLTARALAQMLVRELEYGRAMELLDLVLKHNPRDVDLALSRAEILRRLARFEEAAEAYQKVLRFQQIDRDYVLGELGKTYFESGQVDQARRLWRQIQNKLYAGSLLKNNGLIEEAISVYEEGIRLKPDEFALHRNLIGAFEAAGKQAEALAAARRLLDLEPGNVMNIERLAEAYLRAGDRAVAAQIASRLFSADVGVDRSAKGGPAGSSGYQSFAMSLYRAQYSQYSAAYGYYGGSGRSNLDRGVGFFTKNGLLGELEEVLTEQLAAQPDNAVLKDTAADLFMSQLNKPERAMAILRELETAKFPVERQEWLGQCSQRDYMRIKQYNLVASKPSIRDAELASLEGKTAETLSRDQILELAVIRGALGAKDKAMELLAAAVKADASDTLALGMLTNLLIAAEKYGEAEPHARRLADLLATRREQLHAETLERVRRDFVRSLPLEFQLRVNEAMLSDIADKWTPGEGWNWYGAETMQAVGYQRARLNLGTICAETGRMEEARAIWKDLSPRRGPDVDRWTMLGDTAQLHKQEDMAFEFYEQALKAARQLAGDPLMQQVYTSTTAQLSWYGEQGAIDKTFGSIVESFSKRNKLLDLYDFLRDTDQEGRARKVAEQYKLGDSLKQVYVKRVEEARAAYKSSPESRLRASPAYFAQVCKLAELYDRDGQWEEAQKVYEAYLTDFPDELGLLTLLGEVAEARLETERAIEWEKKVLECKTRLAKTARDWALRNLAMTPSHPSPLGAGRMDPWMWQNRWSRSRWGYGQNELDRGQSWMRLAHLYMAAKNTIAAGDALQRSVADAGPQKDQVIRQVITLIQQRQLTGQMLPVLRTLAVYAPSDERVQLAFAESLEAGGKKELAAEVCNRMLRRGVSDLGVLAEVQRRVSAVSGKGAPAGATLATVEAEVAADSANLKNRLRLAKAYYYSLLPEKAMEVLVPLVKEAPHLEDVHDLLIELYTLRGESDKLIEALKAKADRLGDDRQRRTTRWRLVDELLSAGKTDEALAVVKELGDPRDPRSYQRIGTLLRYFGKHDEAIACLEQAGKSRGARGGREGADFSIPQSLAMRGDFAAAADKLLEKLDEQSRQQVQYGGLSAMYMNEGNPFATIEHFFALYPALAEEVGKRLEARRAANAADPQAIKLLMSFNRSMGREDKAEEMLEQVAAGGAADQALVVQQIDLAVKKRKFDRAIELAEKFIAQAPKPKLPPGMPAQYAGAAMMQSPRTMIVCKLGDIYWDRGEPGDRDKAFETYKQLVDEKIEETRLAYAAICVVRGRLDEARTLVDEALAAREVKPPPMLLFQALICALDGKLENAFDALALAAAPGNEGDSMDRFGNGESPIGGLSMLAERSGMMDKFATFAKSRIEKNPNEWENYSTLIGVYTEQGKVGEAMALIDQASANTALVQEATRTKLDMRRTVAPVEELIPLYEKLIELSEKDVQSVQRQATGGYPGGYPGEYGNMSRDYRDALGELLWEKGEAERAEKLWMEQMSTQQAATHLKLARLLVTKGAYDKAEKAFGRAIELDPDNVTAHRGAAEAAFHRGDRRAALRHMLEVFQQTAGTDSRERVMSYDPDDEMSGSFQEAQPMTLWAGAIAADSELSSYLADPALADRQEECRLMLASLTGDWKTIESLLRPRIEGKTTDPVAWRLWSRVLQRKGDWQGAAGALDYLRRVKLTTLSGHRERLKLVLAGKQLKEAAAGTRQAQQQPTPQMPGMPQQMYSAYGQYDDYQYGGQPNALLPSIYVKLGNFAAAERYYLISAGGDGAENRLPALAALMWEQSAKDRALELMRMSLATSVGRYGGGQGMLPQYAAMLADAGKQQEAVDLLIRAYRWDSSAANPNGYYGMMYGSWDPSEQFQPGEEQTISTSLYQVLKKTGLFDATAKRLADEAAADPGDEKLAKLVLGLHMQAGTWAPLRDALEARRAGGKPASTGMILEQLHAECQLGEWDRALALVEELRKVSPRQAKKWSAHEVFVHLMRGDMDKAVASAKPLLESFDAGEQDWEGQGLTHAAVAALAASGRHDELAAYLERKKANAELDEAGHELLFRVMVIQKRWEPALAMGLEQFWKSDDVLTRSGRWWRALSLLRSESLKQTSRPVDSALVTLLQRGPKEGMTAFAALGEDSVDALRGGVFAATLAGDDAAVLKANRRLLEVLTPIRMTAWHRPPAPSVQEAVKRSVEQLGEAGTPALAQGMGYSMQLSQMLGQHQQRTVMHDALWRPHQQLQTHLLARAGELDELRKIMQEQSRTLGRPDDHEEYSTWRSMSAYGSVMTRSSFSRRYYSGYRNQGNTDWREQFRSLLARAGQMAALWSEYEKMGSRVPERDMPLRDQACAALGKGEAAAAFRRRRALDELAEMRAADTPDLGASRGAYYGYWYGYYGGRGEMDAHQIRAALMAPLVDEKDNPDASPPRAQGDVVVEAAMADPEVAAALTACAEEVGPGWGGTRTLRTLTSYFRVKREPGKVLQLIERACTTQELTRSQVLAHYVWACYQANAGDKLEKIFEEALKVGPTLESDIAIARLVFMHKSGQGAGAAAEESKILSRCTKERPNTHRPAAGLVPESFGTHVDWVGEPESWRYSRYGRFGGQEGLQQLNTVPELAEAIGVRFERSVREDDVTVQKVRQAYQRAGLYEQAAQLLDREIAEAVHADEKAKLALERAKALSKAGKADPARQTIRESEAALRQAVQSAPSADGYWRLAQVYLSEAMGPDFAKAYEAISAAKKIDPACDPSGVSSVHCLYKLGRFGEAVEAWKAAERETGVRQVQEPTVFYAGISAARAGDKDLGKLLIREALYRYPESPLAAQARESIDEH